MDTDPVCMDNLADSINWTLLLRHLAGEDTPAEAAAIARWIDAAAGRSEYVASLRRIVETADAAADGFDRSAGWRALAKRYALDAAVPAPHTEPQPQSTNPRISAPYRESRVMGFHHIWPRGVGGGAAVARTRRAASLLAAFALGVALAVGGTTALGRRLGRESWDVQARDYLTVAGQRAAVTLVDGTRLTLAPASRLRVPRDYAAGNRTVTLDGEAFFSVVHDAAHPFRVRAAGAIATDVGTQFDVRAYSDDAHVRVAVAEGRVDVVRACERGTCRRQARARTLGAGDVATVDVDTVAVANGADVNALTSWVGGALVFRNARVTDVARELARWYDLDVRISDSALGRRPLTATLAADSLGAVLPVLEIALDARAVRVGRLLTLSPRIAPGDLVKRIRRPMS